MAKSKRASLGRVEPLRSLPIRIEDIPVMTQTGKGKKLRRWVCLERREVIGERVVRLDLGKAGGGSRVYRLAQYGRVLARSRRREGVRLDRVAMAEARAELGRRPAVRPRLSAAERAVLAGGPERYPPAG